MAPRQSIPRLRSITPRTGGARLLVFHGPRKANNPSTALLNRILDEYGEDLQGIAITFRLRSGRYVNTWSSEAQRDYTGIAGQLYVLQKEFTEDCLDGE